MSEPDEDWDRDLGGAGRLRFYLARVEALEAECAASNLPHERVKLRVAAERFRELAAGEARILQRKAKGAAGSEPPG